MKKVLVAGCNGYIGNALVQKLLYKGYEVWGIDNDIKLKWTKNISSSSVIPILSIKEKIRYFSRIGKFKYFSFDVSKNHDKLEKILKNGFFAVINLAQQPSAAYSHLSLETAIETLNNNINSTLNFLWLISKNKIDTHYIEIESMGTYEPDIGISIPEGYFYPLEDILSSEAGIGKESLFPRRPGSLYHSSKVMNSYLVDCANRWWDLTITAINQGVVYGNRTDEIEETNIDSPLWIDECFGTVINRFIAQSLLNIPLTIYGGHQKRGFLSLNDSVYAIVILMENPPEKGENVRFVNQLIDVFSIKEIADVVSDNQIIIDSPRIENTNEFYYNPITETLEDLGFEKTSDIKSEVEYIRKRIDFELLEKNKILLMEPKIKWKF